MEATSLSHFKSGDIIKMNAIFGMSAIGIFREVDANTNILFCYCASHEDLRERVYFSHGERFCTFSIDGIIQVDYATNFEIKTLYDKIIGQYEKEEKDLYDYFTDSTYFELKDWFAYNCGINNEDGNYPSFVDEFVAYAWKVLCEKTNNVEEHKTESSSKVLWIARDIYNGLNLFEEKPVIPNPSGYNCYYSNRKAYKIDDELFPEVNETNSPQRIRIEFIKN